MKSEWNRRDMQLEIIRFITKRNGKASIRSMASYFAMDEFEMMENIKSLSIRGQVDYDEVEVWLAEPGSFKKSEFETYFS